VENIKNKFDLVLIDEAHHVPAKTWTEILESTNEAKHFLFTATPF
jgi:superfamily II DNA or RNA helicase